MTTCVEAEQQHGQHLECSQGLLREDVVPARRKERAFHSVVVPQSP